MPRGDRAGQSVQDIISEKRGLIDEDTGQGASVCGNAARAVAGSMTSDETSVAVAVPTGKCRRDRSLAEGRHRGVQQYEGEGPVGPADPVSGLVPLGPELRRVDPQGKPEVQAQGCAHG